MDSGGGGGEEEVPGGAFRDGRQEGLARHNEDFLAKQARLRKQRRAEASGAGGGGGEGGGAASDPMSAEEDERLAGLVEQYHKGKGNGKGGGAAKGKGGVRGGGGGEASGEEEERPAFAYEPAFDPSSDGGGSNGGVTDVRSSRRLLAVAGPLFLRALALDPSNTEAEDNLGAVDEVAGVLGIRGYGGRGRQQVGHEADEL